MHKLLVVEKRLDLIMACCGLFTAVSPKLLYSSPAACAARWQTAYTRKRYKILLDSYAKLPTVYLKLSYNQLTVIYAISLHTYVQMPNLYMLAAL